MEKMMALTALYKVAEIELIYRNKVKVSVRPQIKKQKMLTDYCYKIGKIKRLISRTVQEGLYGYSFTGLEEKSPQKSRKN